MSDANTVSSVITRVRAWARHCNLSKSGYAAAVGLRDTTLRAFHQPDWNPTRETLEKLESVIPAGWQAKDSVPGSDDAVRATGPSHGGRPAKLQPKLKNSAA